MNLHDGSVVGKSGKNWRNDEEDEDEADEACSGQFANVPGIVKYYFQYSLHVNPYYFFINLIFLLVEWKIINMIYFLLQGFHHNLRSFKLLFHQYVY